MGGGDLNLKKSWHPALLKNQKKVYEAEKVALDERKRTQQRIQELKEERAKEETQRQLEAAGGRKRIDRVDWMYEGPTNGQTGTTEEREAYLLGKRRVDHLIKGSDEKQLEKNGAGPLMAGPTANTARDMAAKIKADPLLEMKRREQTAYEEMMNDPVKRRKILIAMGMADEKPEKPKRNDREERHRRKREKRQGDDDRSRGRRFRPRSRSPQRHKHRDSDRRRDDGERERRRDGSESSGPRSRSKSRSRSPRRSGRRENGSYRERDDVRRNGHDRFDHRDDFRDHERRRSDEGRYRNGNSWDDKRGGRREWRDSRDRDERDGGNGHGRRSHDRRRNQEQDDERARKLAEMQVAASELDLDRGSRLAALSEKEQAEREAENKARAEASKHGGDRKFADDLRRQANNRGLAENIGRGRRGLDVDDD